MSVRRTTIKDYQYEKRVILEVEKALACIDDDITDALRHWELTYLSGMMGLKYDISYGDSWIIELQKWAEKVNLSFRGKLAIRAIDRPLDIVEQSHLSQHVAAGFKIPRHSHDSFIEQFATP